jgi:cytochrome c-type biogenesis protein CcmH
LARDLRVLVRERIAEGDSDEQVLQYVVDRYGDWVLLDPPFKGYTYALWFGPLVLLALAGIGVLVFFRSNRRTAAPTAPLSADEQARLDRLLGDDEPA